MGIENYNDIKNRPVGMEYQRFKPPKDIQKNRANRILQGAPVIAYKRSELQCHQKNLHINTIKVYEKSN